MKGILDAVNAPRRWRWLRFDRVVDRVQETNRPGLLPLSVFLDEGVVPRSSREDNYNALGSDPAKYLAVRPGDLVFNKLRTWQGGLGVSRFQGIVSPAYFVCRPRPIAEPRYLHYLLRSSPYLQELTRISKWMPPSQFDISWESLRLLPTLVPPLPTQVLIADHLDAETSRIDAFIAKKQRMTELLEEKRAQVFPSVLARMGFHFPDTLAPNWTSVRLPPDWRVMHLSQVLRQLTNGYVGPTRDILRDEGVMYIQSLHIKDGRIDFTRGGFFVDDTWHRERPRIHLRPGDVLIVQTGDIGQVAVVPPNFGEASCHALQIARVREDFLSGEYLGAYLRSPFGYQSLLSRATGALHPHLEGGIRDVPVVVPPRPAQNEILTASENAQAPLNSLVSSIEGQLNRLVEHRQALVSAAVTGELEVPGVA